MSLSHKVQLRAEGNVMHKFGDAKRIEHEILIMQRLMTTHGIVETISYELKTDIAGIGCLTTPKAVCDAFALCEQYTVLRSSKLAFLRFIIVSVNHMHSRDIYHGDIKLENILVYGDEKFKLIDFEYSGKVDLKAPTKLGYVGPYVAPECFVQSMVDPLACDMWAAGMCIYVFWCDLRPPFHVANSEQDKQITADNNKHTGNQTDSMYALFLKLGEAFLIHNFCRFAQCEAIKAASFTAKMLQVDVSQRITAAKFEYYLEILRQ